MALLSVIALSGLGGGCASRAANRHTPLAAPNQGGSWDVVLSGPMVADAGDAGPGREYARLDARMNRRDEGALYPLDSWPEEARPSLARARRITIPTNADSVQFYGTRRDTRYDWYWYGY